jgi:DNA-binding CsgD family transcriptional regulator/tetratricopeptide (TPR) repeat protein
VHRLLAGVEPELETQARHLGLATLGPDPVVAAALEAAALDARSRGATEIAVDLLRLAVSRTPEGDGGRRDVLLGEAMFEAGDITATAAWLDERLTSLPPGTLRARALITRGVAEWYRSDGPAASAFLTAAIDDARDDPALLGQLYSRLAIFSDGDAGQARERAARAVEVLGLAGESDLLACALSNLFYYEVLSGRAPRPELLDRGLLMEDPRGSVDQSTTPGFWYLALDRWEQARDRFQTMLDRDRSRGDLSSEPELLTRLGEVAAHSTDWPAAQRYARAASAAARQLGHDGSYQPSGRLRLLLDVFGGDVGRAATAALGEADRFAEQGEHLAAASYLAVATFAAASANDPRRVVTLTGRTAHHLAAVGIAEPLGRLDPAPERAEALVVLGDLDAAEALLDAIARRLDRIPRPWLAAAHLRASAQLAAARGDMNHAITLTETRGVPDWSRFEQARVLLVRGRLLRRARRGNAAARCLAEAGETFAALGAGAWSAQVSDALSRVRRRSADPDALTATERRIAALAAAGATNLEMAVELHMSHKTVEVHLTHIYRKLNIRSRGELGAAVGSGRRL